MKVIIIDDERLARKEMNSLLSSYPEIEVIAECSNADDAIKSIEKNQPDLIFLDIEMPEKNGFDLLAALDKVPKVIFVTAYNDYALKAFDVNAIGYITKPVDPEKLKKVLTPLIEDFSQRSQESLPKEKLGLEHQIFLKDGEKCWFVTLKDIRYFESEGNYIRVFFNDEKPLILKSLNLLEEKLDNAHFFRANRKNIVNLKHISNIENWFSGTLRITLRANEYIEVSRRQSSKFKSLMSL
ncbi:MAG: LytTR family DNA-binding domain-containing protein [Flavobacteriales bacterium]|jgi:two-component system LytT family response regulator|nr:LytTR family DNA-binding domain-containing protein [Flavobacteriales bacterium]